MVHSLFSTGTFTLLGLVTKNGVTTLEQREGTLNELHGRLGFIDSIDLYNRKDADPQLKPAPLSKKERMYRQFLIYKDFYTTDRPVIVCEGKTDIVYLKYAIRSLATHFPLLTEVDPGGNVTLKVRLYKYPKSSTARILGLSDGGNSVLPKFIGTYKEDTDKFRAPGQKQPIIILYDNDADAQKIRKAIKDAVNVIVKPGDPYAHVVRNMYAMPTPLPAGTQESVIEDFFETAIKGTVLGGKTFTKRNKFDNTQHYGKHIFAEHVVKPKAATINFDGFRPLLTILENIIKDHAAAVTGTAATAP